MQCAQHDKTDQTDLQPTKWLLSTSISKESALGFLSDRIKFFAVLHAQLCEGLCRSLSKENCQLVTDEPVKYEK